MSRRDAHLDAMLRHLGAAYYLALQGQGSLSEVERALESVEDARQSSGAAGDELAGAGARARGRRGAGVGPGRDEH